MLESFDGRNGHLVVVLTYVTCLVRELSQRGACMDLHPSMPMKRRMRSWGPKWCGGEVFLGAWVKTRSNDEYDLFMIGVWYIWGGEDGEYSYNDKYFGTYVFLGG